MEFINLKYDLKKSVEQAEEYAIINLQNNVEFSPYISLGEKKIQKIIADSVDEAIEIAQEEIENLDEETVVFVYKDTIQLTDETFDAIITQLFNEDEECGYSYGLVYKIENSKISFLNKHIFLGNIRNCLVF
ncbi:hypothetical protein [Testudinibacter aquarius]|uniref:Uncharacterized protein n=1 Tax=Testudinibacter aquarius TaxID=1524974 RepID=A0A4V2W286_9PAST|nr:hypothetical protein [Testudinibacter aquarius]KAE9526287.1 hypothetical protein A1D24_02480 [Testudinibacter aquarius]TCV87099.1 hypothetical protein EDC16_10516 [Testudinibacter aquarius]